MTKKRVGDIAEDELIHKYFAPIAEDLSNDTAALTVMPDHQLLVSTDALVEGIHFLRECPALLVAHKVVRSNASDILADGGCPRWMTLSLSMPRDLPIRWLESFVSGISDALKETGIKLVGGDTTAAMGQISISATVMGTTPADRRVGRSGARVGDWVGVTGELGGSALGLEMMLGKHPELDPLVRYSWMERHFIPPFRSRFAQGVAAQGLVTAMMDLSDGLYTDLPRLCKANDLGAKVEISRIPISDEARGLGMNPREAVRSGEDFELLFTVDRNRWKEIEEMAQWADVPVTRIGAIVHEPGVRFMQQGNELEVTLPTWKHFG